MAAALHVLWARARRFARCSVLALAVIAPLSPLARATDVDPSLPWTLVVGPAPGFSPMSRVDAQRRGRSLTPLPRRPHALWRRTLRGGLDATPLAVDARGAIVAASAHAPELTQFAPDGTEVWHRPTGVAPSISGVVLLNDATRMVITSAGEAVGFSPAGALRFRVAVDMLERTSRIGLLPLEDGGVAVAAGSEVIALDAEGRARFRVRLPERIQGPLVACRPGVVATTQGGTVYLVNPSFVTRLGELGGDPGEGGASSPDGSRLFAVVDGQRLVVFDLAKGSVQSRFGATDRSLLGPVVFGRDDALVTATSQGVMLVWAEAGGSPARISFESRPLSPAPDAGRIEVPLPDDTPPPLPDALGRIAFARAGGRVGIVAPDGVLRWVDEPVCSSPVAVAPAGPYRLAVGCRTGSIVMLGDELL